MPNRGDARTIEEANKEACRGCFKFALFDFDGTLSLIREGWQAVMVPYFVEELLRIPGRESPAEIESVVSHFVEHLTGKQTIYQCFKLCEEIDKRGGTPKDPLEYKHEYLARLWERIEHRVAGLKSGEIENGKAAGGFALGVASDEAHPGGLDEWKRERLLRAGADAIIRDFAETDELMPYLFPTHNVTTEGEAPAEPGRRDCQKPGSAG